MPCSPSPVLGGQGGTEGPGPQPQPRMTFAASLRKLSGGLVAESCPALTTPWTVARQAPLSMAFPKQESWSGLPFPSPGELPDPGIEPGSPASQADALPTELWPKGAQTRPKTPLPLSEISEISPLVRCLGTDAFPGHTRSRGQCWAQTRSQASACAWHPSGLPRQTHPWGAPACSAQDPPAPRTPPAPGRGSEDAPVEAVTAGPVDAGVAAALVDLRQAGGVVVALGAAAGEAVDAILTGAPVVAGAVRTLVNVDVTHTPCGRPSSSDTGNRRGVGLPALGASVSLSVSTPLPRLHPRPSRGSDSHRYKLCSRDPGPTLDTLRAQGSMCTGSLAPLRASLPGCFSPTCQAQGCPSQRQPDPPPPPALPEPLPTATKAAGPRAGPP